MMGGGNVDSNWSEKKMEGEDSVKRTVDCLRGRLLAERVTSRNAKEEAHKLDNRLIELENLLREEAKSRNRAEKKLKCLMRKLESMNISYYVSSDETEHSGLVDKTDISSVSSSSFSSGTKEVEEKTNNSQLQISTTVEGQEPKEIIVQFSKSSEISLQSDALQIDLPESEVQEHVMGSHENPMSPRDADNFGQNVPKNNSVVDSLTSEGERLESSQSCSDSTKKDDSVGSSNEDGIDQESDNQADNSLALVRVDTPERNHQRVDPEVLDATVKEVLDALRHAKEQLQSSMERRRVNMIKV